MGARGWQLRFTMVAYSYPLSAKNVIPAYAGMTSFVHVLGMGIEPSQGVRKGIVTDVNALSAAIMSSVHKAEKSSGYEIGRAFVSVAGGHIESLNSKGAVESAGETER